MKPKFTMRHALTDPSLLGNMIAGPSWFAHRTMLIAAFGEKLTDDERATFTRLTGGRAEEPLQRVETLCEVVGRRGGKSKAMAAAAAYIAACADHPELTRGEEGIVL